MAISLQIDPRCFADHVADDLVHHDHQVFSISADCACRRLKPEKEFWTSTSRPMPSAQLKGGSNPFRALAETGKQAYEYHESNKTRSPVAIGTREWTPSRCSATADAIISRLQTGFLFSASVGATAPFVGLLGTVIGIYNALIAIRRLRTGSIERWQAPSVKP